MDDSNFLPPGEEPLRHPGAIDGLPEGVVFDNGFRLFGTPIGLDGARGAGMHLLTRLDGPVPARGETVLFTPFLAAALGAEARGLQAMPLDYHRKVRLGQVGIRLLPAGLGPGSAQFEVTFKDRTILFSGGVSLAQPLNFQSAELPACDMLILDVKPADPRPPSPKRAAADLKRWVNGAIARRQVPAVVLGSRAAAFDVAWSLAFLDCEIRACRPIFEMLKRVEALGFAVPRLRRLEQEWPRDGVVLHLSRLWPESGFAAQNAEAVAFAGPGKAVPEWAEAGFRIAEAEDRPGIVSYVKKVKSSKVALGPACDEALSEMLVKAGVEVFRLPKPRQMELPF